MVAKYPFNVQVEDTHLRPWTNQPFKVGQSTFSYVLPLPAVAFPLSFFGGPGQLSRGERRPYIQTDAGVIEKTVRSDDVIDVGNYGFSEPRVFFAPDECEQALQAFLSRRLKTSRFAKSDDLFEAVKNILTRYDEFSVLFNRLDFNMTSVDFENRQEYNFAARFLALKLNDIFSKQPRYLPSRDRIVVNHADQGFYVELVVELMRLNLHEDIEKIFKDILAVEDEIQLDEVLSLAACRVAEDDFAPSGTLQQSIRALEEIFIYVKPGPGTEKALLAAFEQLLEANYEEPISAIEADLLLALLERYANLSRKSPNSAMGFLLENVGNQPTTSFAYRMCTILSARFYDGTFAGNSERGDVAEFLSAFAPSELAAMFPSSSLQHHLVGLLVEKFMMEWPDTDPEQYDFLFDPQAHDLSFNVRNKRADHSTSPRSDNDRKKLAREFASALGMRLQSLRSRTDQSPSATIARLFGEELARNRSFTSDIIEAIIDHSESNDVSVLIEKGLLEGPAADTALLFRAHRELGKDVGHYVALANGAHLTEAARLLHLRESLVVPREI
jgi:hypothetical protein